jgi:hypothetical protein
MSGYLANQMKLLRKEKSMTLKKDGAQTTA